jgi:hypothetical protein
MRKGAEEMQKQLEPQFKQLLESHEEMKAERQLAAGSYCGPGPRAGRPSDRVLLLPRVDLRKAGTKFAPGLRAHSGRSAACFRWLASSSLPRPVSPRPSPRPAGRVALTPGQPEQTRTD